MTKGKNLSKTCHLGLLVVLIALTGCFRSDSASSETRAESKRQHCAMVRGSKYCFDYDLAYVPSKNGVLLELPLGALDAPCNTTRNYYKSTFVLFGEEYIPDPEVIRRNNLAWDPESKVEVFAKSDFLFRGSLAEYEECYPSKGPLYPRVTCNRRANWHGALLEFDYDQKCPARARQFARDLESFLEKARR